MALLPALEAVLSLVFFREAEAQKHVGEAQACLLEWKRANGVYTMAVGSSWCGGQLMLGTVSQLVISNGLQ